MERSYPDGACPSSPLPSPHGPDARSAFESGARGTNIRRNRISRDDFDQTSINQDALQSVPVPAVAVDDQHAAVERLEGVVSAVRVNDAHLTGLQRLKAGLLDDLLTGRIRVPA